MKIQYAIGFVLLLVLTGNQLRAASGNLVRNGSFNDELKYWKVTFPEANETNYGRNHQWIEVVTPPTGNGKCLRFTLNSGVAATEGVKACTELIKIDPHGTYEFGAEIMSTGPSAILFIEGYREDKERNEAGNDQYPGYVRCYRAQLQVKNATGTTWKTAMRTFTPKKGYEPTHVLIKLYACLSDGRIYFRNVFLRQVKSADPDGDKKK